MTTTYAKNNPPNFQKITTGIYSISVSASSTNSITIPHNLNHYPAARVYWKTSANDYLILSATGGEIITNSDIYLTIWAATEVSWSVDETNLYLVIDSDTALTITAYYIIYGEHTT